MRTKVLLLLSASILITGARAADATDSSVREYILSRISSTGDDWYKDDLSDLTARQKEVGKRPRVSETSDIKKQIAVEKAKLYFLREMRSSIVKKVDAEKIKLAVELAVGNAEVKKKLDDDLSSSTKSIGDLKSSIQTREVQAKQKQDEAKPVAPDSPEHKKIMEDAAKLEADLAADRKTLVSLEQTKVDLEAKQKAIDQGVQLENGLKVKAVVDTLSDGKKKVKVNLEFEPSENTKRLPKEVSDNLSAEEMKALIEDKVGENLFDRTYAKDKKKEDIVKDMASDPVRNDISKTADGKIADARTEIGSKDDPNSELGKKQIELDEKNGVGKEDELRDLDAKKKIASYIKANPSAKEMDPCDLVMKAVGWSALSTKSRQECSEKDPALQKKDKAVADSLNSENKKVQEAAQSARAKELLELQQHCEGLYRQRAMQESTNQVTQPIDALMDKLVLQYNSSELYASICAPQTGEGADAFDASIVVDPHAEAARLAQRMLTDSEKLQKERDAVSLVMRRSIYSLERSGNMMGGALTANAQTGMLDMTQMKAADAKVQRMAAIYNCSKSILDAIDAAIAQRRLEINGQLGTGMVGTSGTGLNGAVGTVNVNSASGIQTNRRVINNGQRPATQRTNQLLRNGGGASSGNRAPAPNYMGN